MSLSYALSNYAVAMFDSPQILLKQDSYFNCEILSFLCTWIVACRAKDNKRTAGCYRVTQHVTKARLKKLNLRNSSKKIFVLMVGVTPLTWNLMARFETLPIITYVSCNIYIYIYMVCVVKMVIHTEKILWPDFPP
jgi:hypothetical protein